MLQMFLNYTPDVVFLNSMVKLSTVAKLPDIINVHCKEALQLIDNEILMNLFDSEWFVAYLSWKPLLVTNDNLKSIARTYRVIVSHHKDESIPIALSFMYIG